MTNRFYMMIGIPGSGKSYFAEKMAKSEGFIIHSSDEIRREWGNKLGIEPCNMDTFEILHNRVIKDLKEGKDVVMDATNLGSKRRRLLLEKMQKIKGCFKVAFIVATPFDICLAQNTQRQYQVPEKVIYQMRERFEFPMLFEGFDEIAILNTAERESYEDIYFGDNMNPIFDSGQDNYHHTRTIKDHCLKTNELVTFNMEDNGTKECVQKAALLHDIGKVFTKTFKDSKGNTSDIAHYYGHENVSAYEAIFWLYDYYNKGYHIDKIIYICQLINKHMQPHTWINKKTHDKYKKLYTKEFYDDLMTLHEYDKIAH